MLLLTDCQPPVPPPPISIDTTTSILRSVYDFRASLQVKGIPPPQAESLLSIHTFYLLKRYNIDTIRWSSTRRYYARYPQRLHALIESTLTVP
ncbi:MAG: hypothetical protein N3E49_08690 [Bacteroidia bacterium]|nr:hypothetical protein [Bacteroidia bacterium]